MGLFGSFLEKIPFLSNLGGKKKSNKSNVELQYDKAINQMENGNAEEAIEILEKIVDTPGSVWYTSNRELKSSVPKTAGDAQAS